MSYIDKKTSSQLIGLRAIAISLQILILVFTESFIEMLLPLTQMLSVISLYFLFNVYLWYRYQQDKSETANRVLVYLIIDVLVLCALLYYAGGATNPLVSLLLFPLTISATLLNARFTWFMATITITLYSLLLKFYHPLPHNHAFGHEFSLHVFGMWFGFIVSAALVSYFIVSLRKTIAIKEEQLHIAREQALKDKQLVSLATLSASTSHELGTPLGTISLLSEELSNEIKDESIQKSLIAPLKNEVKRCKEILSILTTATGGVQLNGGKKMPVDQFVGSLITQWKLNHPLSDLSIQYQGEQPAPSILAEHVLHQAIVNILDNAQRVSKQGVSCILNWEKENIVFCINDTGPGLHEDEIKKMGHQPLQNTGDGMGLGLFLSLTIVEKMGGTILFSNREQGGLSTQISLPRF